MTTRRGFLKGVLGAGAAIAANKIASPVLVELKCKSCQGVLKQAGDILECEYCGAKYALGGVVMQEEGEKEPKRVIEEVAHVCDSTGEIFDQWGMTSAYVVDVLG